MKEKIFTASQQEMQSSVTDADMNPRDREWYDRRMQGFRQEKDFPERRVGDLIDAIADLDFCFKRAAWEESRGKLRSIHAAIQRLQKDIGEMKKKGKSDVMAFLAGEEGVWKEALEKTDMAVRECHDFQERYGYPGPLYAREFSWVETMLERIIKPLLDPYRDDPEVSDALKRMMKTLDGYYDAWHAIDETRFEDLRADAREGRVDELMAELQKKEADRFVTRFFGLEEKVKMEKEGERTRDMVFYQPTPHKYFLQMLDAADLKDDDVFYDLGCGCGVVTTLTALLSKAKVKGVEFDPAYAQKARDIAKTVGAHVEILNMDVKNADLSDGTVFYLFNPFVGDTLKAAMDKIREAARTKQVWVFSLHTDDEWSRQRDFHLIEQHGFIDEFTIGPTEEV